MTVKFEAIEKRERKPKRTAEHDKMRIYEWVALSDSPYEPQMLLFEKSRCTTGKNNYRWTHTTVEVDETWLCSLKKDRQLGNIINAVAVH